jgi:Cu(I)/Ag(I) efflux system protein CusF
MRSIGNALVGIILISLVSVARAEWVSGEIRRLDPANHRLTIKHAEIKSLDMPPMTMVFQVRDPALFGDLKVGDSIQFQAQMEGTRYLVTSLRKSPP